MQIKVQASEQIQLTIIYLEVLFLSDGNILTKYWKRWKWWYQYLFYNCLIWDNFTICPLKLQYQFLTLNCLLKDDDIYKCEKHILEHKVIYKDKIYNQHPPCIFSTMLWYNNSKQISLQGKKY
jgi:hypothetical protein